MFGYCSLKPGSVLSSGPTNQEDAGSLARWALQVPFKGGQCHHVVIKQRSSGGWKLGVVPWARFRGLGNLVRTAA